ncbi:MAG: proline racemase family protein [Pseudomonadota bacterium]
MDPAAPRPELIPPSPAGAKTFHCVEAHTEGEPLRIILSGFEDLRGDTILARRRDAHDRLDHLRRALMWEPRGHADMYGCIVVPAEREGSDFGVLFTHNEGYSTMCGHGVLAMARVAVELGLVPVVRPVTTMVMDTPAGPVRATVRLDQETGAVQAVSFQNVPSWVVSLDREIHVPDVGVVPYDVAFGGAFYAYLDADAVGLTLEPASTQRLIEAGRAIKQAVQAADRPRHPVDEDLSFLYGTIFTGPASDPEHHSRHVCVFADGEVDRSPTGTGVSGRLALLRAREQIAVAETIGIESILGSRFYCRVVEEHDHGGGLGSQIVPEVEGRAWVTGATQWVIDPEDPFREGFLLR